MFKHIIGQAIYQFIIMMVLTFLADQFIPEYFDEYDGILGAKLGCKYNGGYMRSGRGIFVDGTPDYDLCFREFHVFSRHFTFIFNTFVMMQIFNFLNARKLQDEVPPMLLR